MSFRVIELYCPLEIFESFLNFSVIIEVIRSAGADKESSKIVVGSREVFLLGFFIVFLSIVDMGLNKVLLIILRLSLFIDMA